MSDHKPEELVHREKSSIGPIVSVGLIFLPILYILSPPFVYAFVSGPNDKVFRTIYWPLIFLSLKFEPIQDFYNWYGELFPWIP